MDFPMPQTVAEIRQWADVGLIAGASYEDLIDDVVARILKRVGRHLEIGDAGWDEWHEQEDISA